MRSPLLHPDPTGSVGGPALPPVPVPEGDFRGVKASLERIEAALAQLLQAKRDVEKLIAEHKPILEQVKAKFVDTKSGKIRFWPFI